MNLTLFLIAFHAAVAFVWVQMSLTFLLARRWNNYGIVDAVWSGGFTVLAWIYFGLAHARFYDAKLDLHPEWSVPRALLLAGMVTIWSLRLALHLGRRIAGHHPHEDVRYAGLRQEWGDRTPSRMYGFYLLQGGFQVALSAPFLLALFNDRPVGPWLGLHPLEAAGVLVWLTGCIGEAVADQQLRRFRSRPQPHPDGPVCQSGLWRHSRHPNYFFEWLIWVGFALFALPAPWGWLGLLAPALMYHTLVHVTGIPMTEALSVASKGDAYRAYQKSTNAFFPGPRRS